MGVHPCDRERDLLERIVTPLEVERICAEDYELLKDFCAVFSPVALSCKSSFTLTQPLEWIDLPKEKKLSLLRLVSDLLRQKGWHIRIDFWTDGPHMTVTRLMDMR